MIQRRQHLENHHVRIFKLLDHVDPTGTAPADFHYYVDKITFKHCWTRCLHPYFKMYRNFEITYRYFIDSHDVSMIHRYRFHQ